MSSQTEKGFFKALFDFSFKSYVTPKIIKIVFGIVIAISAILALFFVAAAFKANGILGVFTLLVLAPLAFLFYVTLYRVGLEVVMAIFTIAENTTKMVEGQAPPGFAGVPSGPFAGPQGPPGGPVPPPYGGGQAPPYGGPPPGPYGPPPAPGY